MKTKILALVLALACLSTVATAYALPDRSWDVERGNGFKPQAWRLRSLWACRWTQGNWAEEVPEADPTQIDDLIASLLEAEGEEGGDGVWLLNAHGQATLVDQESEEEQPLAVQALLVKENGDDEAVLYKVAWGRVRVGDAWVQVSGYAARHEGLVYLKLEGEDVSLYAVGRPYSAGIGVRLALKARVTWEGEPYQATMRGRATPLGLGPKWGPAMPTPAPDAEPEGEASS